MVTFGIIQMWLITGNTFLSFRRHLCIFMIIVPKNVVTFQPPRTKDIVCGYEHGIALNQIFYMQTIAHKPSFAIAHNQAYYTRIVIEA